MESPAPQRRLRAVQSHLLPPTAAEDDPQPQLHANITAGEFAHGTRSSQLYLFFSCSLNMTIT